MSTLSFSRIAPGAALALICLAALPALAMEPVNKTPQSGIAIRGYDTVAYFTQGEAVKGKRRYSHEWQGARWLFSNAENRDAFAAEPARFAPQFGGHCAWWMTQGKANRIDPEAFTLHEGRLYLFYSKAYKEIYDGDLPGHIARAEQNWPHVVKASMDGSME